MKAIIYARYSSDNQREESIEGQIRECMEFAERNGITVFGTYIDRALSAKTDNRPEFQRMIKDSYRKLFDTVLSKTAIASCSIPCLFGSWIGSPAIATTPPTIKTFSKRTA